MASVLSDCEHSLVCLQKLYYKCPLQINVFPDFKHILL